MGNIIKNQNEVKSSFFGCGGCSGEKNMCIAPTICCDIEVDENLDNINSSNLNYNKSTDIMINPDEFISSISSVDRNINSKRNKKTNYPLKIKKYDLNFNKEKIDKFDRAKFESNPKIKEILSFTGENSNFILTEKETFYIKGKISQNYLIKKLLHYNDDSYYLGYINKNNNNKELLGEYYYNDGSIYKGFFKNDKIKGRGKLISTNGYIYEGDFDEGLFNGYGKLFTINGTKYEGNWKDNSQDGFGVEKYADGTFYSGTFKKGLKHGKGKFIYKNGDLYEGDFNNDEMTGWGIIKRKDGKIYNGMVKKHIIEGIGVFIWNDNKRYIGEYHNELKEGFGIFYVNDGKYFKGFWKEGKQDGFGKITNIYGQTYYMKYNNGKKLSLSFSEQDKIEIDKLISEGEKRINIEKLNKIADDILIQKREKEQKFENEKKNKNHTNKNLFTKNNTLITENKKLIQLNRITTYNNKIISNKDNISKKDKISNVSNKINSFKINNLVYSENGSLNNDTNEDKNTEQSSKIIITKNKNKSCSNLNVELIHINDKLKKSKSDNVIKLLNFLNKSTYNTNK